MLWFDFRKKRLLRLRDELAKAAGPDRELDFRIQHMALAFSRDWESDCVDGRGNRLKRHPDDMDFPPIEWSRPYTANLPRARRIVDAVIRRHPRSYRKDRITA